MKSGSLPSPRFESSGEDAGNGSLMRLAPIPLFFHTNIEEARAMAFESSLTTHPGHVAAEACALMAHIIVRALTREPSNTSSSAFLDTYVLIHYCMYVCMCMYVCVYMYKYMHECMYVCMYVCKNV